MNQPPPDGRNSRLPSTLLQQFQNPGARGGVNDRSRRWSRGDHLPDQFRQDRYAVGNWQQQGLRRPPDGYRWYRGDNNDFFLAMIGTGIISDVISRSDRDDMWRRGYSRSYSYNDDLYYQQCRRSPDPAGILLGGLIGGLLGNAASHGGGGATAAGVILGGVAGAALTRNMDCEDRSYAYRSYYDGFNADRPGSYQWRNPRNGHYGQFNIDSYYDDPNGFRCARFNQTSYIQDRPYPGRGAACRQPDGSWAVVN
ncbi:MAG TPA: RcnB family protein [Rhizomicrobium sp.]